MKMKAIARFGKEFGSYRMVEVPYPTCGPEDIILEIKAAAICGADMKHWRVDNGSDEFNSIRGHEFAGEIVQVGEKVTDWKVGQRVVSDNSAHVCGVCPACEQGDFLCCEEKVNLGLDNNTWGGGFAKYVRFLEKSLEFTNMQSGRFRKMLNTKKQQCSTRSVTHTKQLHSRATFFRDRIV